MDPSRSKILEWKKKNQKYMEEIKSRIPLLQQNHGNQILSYFTYSIQIAHDLETESMMLGSYHIQNLGSKPFTEPYICLKLAAESPFHFSGKYLYKGALQKIGMTGAWERLNESGDKEEYWLRPTHKESIEPGETLTFSNFQLKWEAKKKYTGNLRGFTYGKEKQEGIPALNQINISGISMEQEGKKDDG